MAVAVPSVGLVACTSIRVGAAAGEVVNVAGAEVGLLPPELEATTCTRNIGTELVLALHMTHPAHTCFAAPLAVAK